MSHLHTQTCKYGALVYTSSIFYLVTISYCSPISQIIGISVSALKKSPTYLSVPHTGVFPLMSSFLMGEDVFGKTGLCLFWTGWLESAAAGLLQFNLLKPRDLYWRGDRKRKNSTSRVAIKTSSTWVRRRRRRRRRKDLFSKKKRPVWFSK